MTTPSIKDLDCLIRWPPGSIGERDEKALLAALLAFCEEHGFGRVPQLAADIEDIWRDPAKRAVYERIKADHFAQMGWMQPPSP